MNGSPSGMNAARIFFALATVMLVVAALIWAQTVLLPLALAMLFTFILTPAVVALERRHVPRVAAVLIVVALVFASLGGIGFVLARQVGQLAAELPRHTDNVKAKIAELRASGDGVLGQLIQMGKEVRQSVQDVHEAAQEVGAQPEAPVPVSPTPGPDLSWLTSFAGSAAEGLASAGLVIILVLFMLLKREDLRDRLIRLFGKGHLTVTTRALDEAGNRISRYLLMLVLVNATYGVAAGLGLFFIGVPYALLWGFLAATLRFIPYVGAWIAAVMPLTLSAATAPGWAEPLAVLGLILVLELLSNNIMEPMVYGRSIGVSEVALLVAAAFWAWVWGPLGLVMSAPLTVCIAVLGKYVPGLEIFEVLLQDEPAFDPPVQYYQRLLAHDEDEAFERVEEYLKDHPWDTVFDEVLVPALLMARRDRERGQLDAEDERYILGVTRQVVDDLVFRRQQLGRIAARPIDEPTEERRAPVLVLGFPAHDEADEVALHMLRLLLDAEGVQLEVLSSRSLAADLVRRASEERPAGIVVAALPPGGLAQARHVCKRLHVQQPDLRIVVGRWGAADDDPERLRTSLREAGADRIAVSLRETRDQITPLAQHARATEASAALSPVG